MPGLEVDSYSSAALVVFFNRTNDRFSAVPGFRVPEATGRAGVSLTHAIEPPGHYPLSQAQAPQPRHAASSRSCLPAGPCMPCCPTWNPTWPHVRIPVDSRHLVSQAPLTCTQDEKNTGQEGSPKPKAITSLLPSPLLSLALAGIGTNPDASVYPKAPICSVGPDPSICKSFPGEWNVKPGIQGGGLHLGDPSPHPHGPDMPAGFSPHHVPRFLCDPALAKGLVAEGRCKGNTR